MPSDTITVRFDRQLYDRIKNHWMCTSDIVRNATRVYLDDLEEEEKRYLGNHAISDVQPEVQQVRSYSVQDENQVKHENLQDTTPYYEEKTETIPRHSTLSNSVDDTVLLMNRLKNEMDELDSELEEIMRKYQHSEEKY